MVNTDITWDGDSDFKDQSGVTTDELGDHDGTIQHGYEQGSLTRGLVGYWPMEHGQSSRVWDAALDNHGTINGATWTAGKMGTNALSFDGVDDYASTGMSIRNGPFTVAVWAYIPSTVSDFAGMVTESDSGATGDKQYSVIIRYDGSNTARLTALINATQQIITTSVTLDRWYHFILTWDGDTLTGYKNGSPISSIACSGDLYQPTNNVDFGRVGQTNYFDGKIDDVRIYDRAISGPEAEVLYNLSAPSGEVETADPRAGLVSEWKLDGDATDSVGANDGTVNGPTFVSGYENWAASFDGVDDYIEVPHDAGLDIGLANKSVSLWVKTPADISGGNGNARFALWKGPGNSRWSLHVDKSSGVVKFAIESSTNGDLTDISSTSDIRGNWTHICAVRDYAKSKIHLHINGHIEASVTDGGQDTSNTSSLLIGNWSGSTGREWSGEIDELRFYDRVLSPIEVEQLFDRGRYRVSPEATLQ